MAESGLPAPCSLRQGMYMFPEKYAKDFQGNPFREQIDVTLFGGAAGSGKALRHGHKVLTPTGWKNIEDMTIGDEVITPKNKVEKVIGVFPQGIKDIYRVSVKDGAYLDVCENHLWKVKLPSGKFEIINTKQLNEFPPKTKSGRNQYLKIDLVDGVDFTEKEFTLPPYIVGALIGDGGLSKQQCAITTKDKETVEKFKALGMNIRHQPSMKYGYGVLGIRDEIKRLKLNVTSVDKFIPVEYKVGSYQQRLELVQGLMDTDGTVSKDGATVTFSTSSKRLAEDLQEVVRSLGGTATITTKEPFYLKDGERHYCNTAYTVYIRHRDRKSLFSLTRKRDRVVKSHPQLMSRIVSVENLGVKDYATCITISGDEKQFISDNYMVSHNSEIGVIDFLKWTDIPNFIGVMTRRTTPQLTGPGGLLTKCKRIFSQAYEPDEYVWRAKDGKFVFHHSGAEIYLKHFENDAADVNWQGAEANLFYVDEGTQFTQHMIQYIMSRMRNPSCPEVKPHLKITCNPDADHFLKKWVEPYLLEDGTPDREKDGMVRFFTFSDGEFVWGDTKEELAERYQVTVDDVISFTYISANVYDNPVVQKINPKYVSWLKGLKGVEKARLLDGNWKVREEGSGFFSRSWVEEIPYVDEDEVVNTVRSFDFAGTLRTDKNPSPDYTASVRMRLLKSGEYVVDDVRRTRIRSGDWLDFILNCAEDDPKNTTYLYPVDPNPSAKRMADLMVRDIIQTGGLFVKKIDTNKSKLDRFRPFSSMSQNGGVKFLSGCGIDYENKIVNELGFVYNELEKFTGERIRSEEGHDDKQTCRQ